MTFGQPAACDLRAADLQYAHRRPAIHGALLPLLFGVLFMSACTSAEFLPRLEPMDATTVPDVSPSTPGPVPAPAVSPALMPEPLPLMSSSDFSAAAEATRGEWRVVSPRVQGCRLELRPAFQTSRTGPVARRGPCFGEALSDVLRWTIVSTEELVLLGILDRPLAVLRAVSPDQFVGEAFSLERVTSSD